MLQIKNISKQYKTGDLVQNALNGVSLNFRDNEFVSILGPSGSGKTTLLNIIGGLDRYDSGDLIINNVSTKKYKDRDWDSYRNHTIGFVFQSYNLIPHQTVLSNVELALTIGGISKKERRERALQALDEVGLKEQAHKRPNQMSGGQMQRVAIARALVNNPSILLADEPTGALDTETSVQVMELLKKVAKDRLVIMVTHNPELAEEYSTRIVRLKDGNIIGDTDAFEPETTDEEPPKHRNLGKASMSLVTAFSLSFNNLLTKKGRTILTSFAGSIGIIGIALILSLSTGFQNYIDQIQEDTLTSYPLTITSETADMTSALLSMASQSGEDESGDSVKERQYISTMFTQIGTNNLRAFKSYLEEHKTEVDDMASMVRYQYSVKPQIYTLGASEKVTKLNPSTLMTTLSGGMMSSNASSMGGSNIFYEMIDDQKTIEQQYDVLAGRFPKAYDELLLVLPEKNGMPDLLIYGLGLRDQKELEDMLSKIAEDEKVEDIGEPLEYTYEELMNIPLKLIDASDMYKYNDKYDIYEDMSEDVSFMKNAYEEAANLKIVGIVCAKEGASATNLTAGVAYTKALTQHVIDTAAQSEIVKKQLEDRDVNVFSNKRFDDDTEEAGLDFEDMISVDTNKLSSAFGMNISEKEISQMTEVHMKNMSTQIASATTEVKKTVNDTLATFITNLLERYLDENEMPGTGAAEIIPEDLEAIVSEYLSLEEIQNAIKELAKEFHISEEQMEAIYKEVMNGLLKDYIDRLPSFGEGSANGTILTKEMIPELVKSFLSQEIVQTAVDVYASSLAQANMQQIMTATMGQMMSDLMNKMASSFQVDVSKIASAFQFNMGEEELMRLMQTMSAATVEQNADTNLQLLGYQNIDKPSSISFYFKDFEAKEAFIDFLDAYNEKMEKEDEERVIKYTDITGLLMSSVKTIVDSVSYVLIAFVSISLVVSSIMIGIITYISVFERTKEIGVLRAIGASKRNISSIFNAETFIVGLFAGLIGIGVTLALVGPINTVIHNVSGNMQINAALPVTGGTILVILSVILTLIGGLIPSKQAAKKDPVLALRSE